MAIAAPAIVLGAEALADAIAATATALAAAIGIAKTKEAIDKTFTDQAPSPVQSCPMAASFVNDPQAKAEHDEYKARANETPPPDLDECERLRWLLQREQDVVDSMTAWDQKWLPGRHTQAVEQRQRAVDKLKDQIKQKCGD